MKLVEDYIKVYEDILTNDECSQYINKIDDDKLHPILDETFSFQVRCIHKVPAWSEEEHHLSSIAYHATQEYFTDIEVPLIPQIQGFETVQIIKMHENDYMDVHVDVNSQLSAKRYLTVMIFFNDFQGRIIFPTIDTSIIPKAGSVVVFPPTWMFPFAVEHAKGEINRFAMTYLHYKNN